MRVSIVLPRNGKPSETAYEQEQRTVRRLKSDVRLEDVGRDSRSLSEAFSSAWVSSADWRAAQRDLQAAPDSLPLGIQ